jgi:hypothetical protein
MAHESIVMLKLSPGVMRMDQTLIAVMSFRVPVPWSIDFVTDQM